MKDSILVTGGTGFVGRTLVPVLRRRFTVRVFRGDIRNQEDIRKALKGCRATVHLAVVKDGPQAFSVNVGGAVALVAACRATGVRRIINVSTQSTKIKTKGSYALSKYQSDRVFKQSGLDVTTLLVSWLYGADATSLFGQISRFIDRLPLIPVFGPGIQRAKPIYLLDLCAIIDSCIRTPTTIGKTYDVGGPEEIDFNHMITLIAKVKGKHKPIVHIPTFVGLVAARVLERILKRPPFTVNNILGSTQNISMDTAAMYRDIPVRPVSPRVGLPLMFDGKSGVRVGVVGLGKMGIMHAALLSTMKDVKVVAVCDQDRTLRTSARSMGLAARFYASPETMMHRELLDAVYICTPTFTHYEIARLAMEYGLHVFAEKPLTEDFRKTETLARLAQRRGVVTAVGYHFLHSPPHRVLKKILDDHILGQHIRIQIILRQSEVLGPVRGWMFTKTLSGGGVVMNPTAHVVSWLTCVFGSPKTVTGSMRSLYSEDVEDEADMLLDFHHAHAAINASWSVPGYPNLSTEIRCEGEKGTAILRGDLIELLLKNTRRTIRNYNRSAESAVDLNPDAYGAAYFYESRAFIRTIAGDPQDLVTFADAVRAERVIYEFYKNNR